MDEKQNVLLIAIPKSASSSLTDTLAKKHHLMDKTSFGNWLFPKGEKRRSLPTKKLHQYHPLPDMDANVIKRIYEYNNSEIYKLHIFPSKKNLSALSDKKKIILLRSPEAVVGSLCRAEKSLIHRPKKEFKGLKKEYEWIQKSREIGLMEDLKKFFYGWKNARDKKTMILDYEDVVHRPKETVNSIENFCGLPLSNQVSLTKKRYSKINPIHIFAKKIRRIAGKSKTIKSIYFRVKNSKK